MKKKLFLFVGPKAIGGTYWMRYLLKVHPDIFKKIKSITTRPLRANDEEDMKDYCHISKGDFSDQREKGEFLETDEYCGEWYGTRTQDILDVLKTHNGIMKITSPGAVAIKQRLVDVPVRIIFLEPLMDCVLRNNHSRRYGDDLSSQEEAKLLASAHEYIRTMHALIPHPDHRIMLMGSSGDCDYVQECFRKEGIELNPAKI